MRHHTPRHRWRRTLAPTVLPTAAPWWRRWWQAVQTALHRLAVRAGVLAAPDIPDALWLPTLAHYPFLAALSAPQAEQLRHLSAAFLARKEFYGSHGLVVTDAMAVQIAAQACLLLLHWGRGTEALGWYDDFVGIVLYPGQALARRRAVDAAGVVHHYTEVLVGEAMERGPIMLSWSEVREGAQHTQHGTNVVIHEFAHKLDMRNGRADGCPPLPAGFRGTQGARAAHALWWSAWEPAYADFQERVLVAQRFGGSHPWLDAYGATSPAEFFAVACEAYFVNRPQFEHEFPTLTPLLDAFFWPAP
ncbi:MAG: zinc-dependent peptidase [Burkholderiaceae bacterium]|nr:zinc-dependent peptidase [Burkholderiaceae bacterium]